MPGFDRLTAQLIAALRAQLASGKATALPEAGGPLWRAFVEISATRTYHPGGPNPISYAEIAAWAQLMRWPLEPRHVAVIRALDAAWLEHAYAAINRPHGGKALPRGSGQPLTPALFDLTVG